MNDQAAQPAAGDRGDGGSSHAAPGAVPELELNLLGSLAVVLVVGVGLVFAARAGALALLVAVAAVQALLILAWLLATSLPGRIGGLLIATSAAGGSDLAVSVWPHSRLGTLLVVFALAIPLMFVHQLSRGAARVRIVESLSGVAVLVAAVSALPALVQLRHEFVPTSAGAHVVAGVIEAAAGALVVGYLVDMIMPAPRFDAAIGRGLLAVVAAAGLGGSVGHLAISDGAQFHGARGAFIGAALGALVGLLAIAVAFIQFSSPPPAGARGLRSRPILSALLPLSVVAPIAFLLCLAVRS